MSGIGIRRSFNMISLGFFRFCGLDTFSRRMQFYQGSSPDKVVNSLVRLSLLISFTISLCFSSPIQLYAGNALSMTLAVTNVTCTGLNNGSINATVSDSSGGTVTFTLTPGALSNTTGIFNNLAPGIYTVSANDAGTLSSASATVSQPTALSVVATSNSPACTNSAVLLSATPSGGTPPYTYSWLGPNSFGSSSQMPFIANPALATAGSYTVTVTDANGCNATSAVTVAIVTAPIVTANASIHTVCAGGAVTLTSSSNIPVTPSLAAPVYTAFNNSTGGTVSNANWTIQMAG